MPNSNGKVNQANYASFHQENFWLDNPVETVFYFAFGSNMDSQRMTNRGVNFKSRRAAKLSGYKLVFNKTGSNGQGYANIVSEENGTVEGVLYETDESSLAKLDRFEGVPTHYYKDWLSVETRKGQKIWAVVYIAQPTMCKAGLLPTKDYLGHLLAGKSFLSQAYYDDLRKHPTLPVVTKPTVNSLSYTYFGENTRLNMVLDGLGLEPSLEKRILAEAKLQGISALALLRQIIQDTF
jgi:gamma-glutamylcyclotransferase (GGCT)/AIG2-like uncharacterized protein YtfP